VDKEFKLTVIIIYGKYWYNASNQQHKLVYQGLQIIPSDNKLE